LSPKEAQLIFLQVLQNTTFIPFDLEKDNIIQDISEYQVILSTRFDLFFHIAALTDFRSTPEVDQKLFNANFLGTQKLLKLLSDTPLGAFCYISSAYACGRTNGKIYADYIQQNNRFRNPYEKTKLLAEKYIYEFFNERKVEVKIFRPSTLCGRLIEKPYGCTCKFDVFYSWAAFLQYQKQKLFPNESGLTNIPIRFCCNSQSGLNIVPADFAAKLILKLSLSKTSQISFHICNNTETPHSFYASAIIDFLNISGCEYVREIPKELNKIESLYYRTVGKIYTPYVVNEPMDFDMSYEYSFMKDINLEFIPINNENIHSILEFAKAKDFGL